MTFFSLSWKLLEYIINIDYNQNNIRKDMMRGYYVTEVLSDTLCGI